MSQQLSELHRTTGKIVSMAMLIDGWVGSEERVALASSGMLEKLGLDEDSFEQIFAEFSAETAPVDEAAFTVQPRIAPNLVETLLDDVTDPELQARLLEAIACVAYADGLLTSEEADLLRMARERWTGARAVLN